MGSPESHVSRSSIHSHIPPPEVTQSDEVWATWAAQSRPRTYVHFGRRPMTVGPDRSVNGWWRLALAVLVIALAISWLSGDGGQPTAGTGYPTDVDPDCAEDVADAVERLTVVADLPAGDINRAIVAMCT